MPDVGLDRLFREVEALADLAVDEAVRYELKHLDLAGSRILAELPGRRGGERDDRTVPTGAAPGSGRLEAAAVVTVAVENLLSLGGVHVSRIGAPLEPL